MNILHVEDFFLPHVGYQINIIPKYQSLQGHNVTILTSTVEGVNKPSATFFGVENIVEKDKEYEKATGVKIIRVKPFTKKIISSRIIQSRKFFKVMEKINPDIIFCHGNDTLTGIRVALKYKKMKRPVVFDSHMLSMASVNRFNTIFYYFYKKIITPILIKNKIPVIRTQDDNYIEKKLGIPLTQSPWISYGSDTLLFRPNDEIKRKFRMENNISYNDFVVVYTGKLDEAKGGKLLAEVFKRKLKATKNIILIVVGNTVGKYGEEVDSTFRQSENRIIRFPTQDYSNLAKFYQAADLSVFPKQCSLSFYDAQACGLPVISEANNININRLLFNNGLNFKIDDIEDFRRCITYFANLSDAEYKDISGNALNFISSNYDYQDKSREYTDILIEEYNKFFGEKRANIE